MTCCLFVLFERSSLPFLGHLLASWLLLFSGGQGTVIRNEWGWSEIYLWFRGHRNHSFLSSYPLNIRFLLSWHQLSAAFTFHLLAGGSHCSHLNYLLRIKKGVKLCQQRPGIGTYGGVLSPLHIIKVTHSRVPNWYRVLINVMSMRKYMIFFFFHISIAELFPKLQRA